MSFFAAMMTDAYRELNSRRMFWITLLLSAFAEMPLLIIGISDSNALTIAWWTTPITLPSVITLSQLLKTAFVAVGVSLWLTWAATILALVSTASIFPDFVGSGSIDLLLCRPIGRLKLFFTKYAGALLFVSLQVGAFSVVAFLIIGLRAGKWSPGLLLAVPLVVTFFSYLFCACALVGVVTRSTVASLLLTLLFWLTLFGANFVDGVMLLPRVANEAYVERLRERIDAVSSHPEPDEARLKSLNRQLDSAQADLESWRKWHRPIMAAKTLLPKTAETIKLLERVLISTADLPHDEDAEGRQQMPFLTPQMRAAGVRMDDVTRRVEAMYRSRSVLWVVGTSLTFEAVVLAIAALIFCRRDF